LAGDDALTPNLPLRRLLVRLALGWEALWPRLFPVLGVLGGGLILALLDLPAALPAWLHLVLLLGWLGLLGWVGWRQARGFHWPDAAAADRRMEADAGLRHRPLEALADQPSGTDPMALALWQVHQRRAAAALTNLRLKPPSPGLPARDPRALRAVLVLGLVAATTIAGGDAGQRLRRGLLPAFGGATSAPALRIEAWVTPPAYTGAAPIFLDPAGGTARVPTGSKLQLALSGGGAALPELVQGEASAPFQRLDAGSFSAEATLEADTTLAVRRNGQPLARWALTVQPDAPPTAEFTEAPGRGQRGLNLRLPWRAGDDWGLASAQVELRLKARPEAPPLTLDLALPGGRPRQARGVAQPELSAHPWAGLEVVLQLVVKDGAGQQGVSDTATLTLPERSFNHPVAKLIIAIRRALSLDPAARRPARTALDAIAAAPEAFEHDATTYLALRASRARLSFDRRPAAVEEVQALLWDTAVALEEGRDARTQRNLAQAEEALRQAIAEAERNPQDAQAREEMQRRIQELREAIRQHLEAMAERLQRENAEALPNDPQQRMMDQRQIDRRTQRMEQAAREGRTEDAKKELAELEEMLKALQEGRQPQQNAERQQRRERGQQQMGVVQDMVQRESQMLDRSHQRAEGEDRARTEQRRQQQRDRQRQQQGLRWPPDAPATPGAEPPADQQAQGQAQQDRGQDGRRQRALRRALGELMQQFGDLTGQVPEALGRADQAMREAQEALGEGQDPRDSQQRALRALQEGGRQMAQQMQRQFGQSQPGEEDGEGEDMAGDQPGGGDGQDSAQQQGEGRDPLGRRTRDVNGTADNGADTRVPDEAELLRTRRIQEELRRREAEKQRPADELDYIDRLLKRF
jgi:uncharacterized protein (TIGR02302 family)